MKRCVLGWFNAESFTFVALLLLFQIGFRERAFFDPGAFWHVRVGEQILSGQLHQQDPFTWTHAGQRWIPQQWLSECCMAKIHTFTGFDGLLLTVSVLMAGTATGFIRRLVAGGCHPILAWSMTLFFLSGVFFHVAARPHLLTILFFVPFTLWMLQYEAKARSFAATWIRLGLLLWLWCNLHGGVLGAYLSLGFLGCGFTLQFLLYHQGPIVFRTSIFRWWVGFLVLLGLVFLNPYGAQLPEFWFRIVGSAAPRELINEHQGMKLQEPMTWLLVGIFLAYCLLLHGVPKNRYTVTCWLPVVWFCGSILSIRHAPLFVIQAFTIVCFTFTQSTIYRRLQQNGDFLIQSPKLLRNWSHILPIPFLLVGSILYLQVSQIQVPVIGAKWANPGGNVAPMELYAAMQEYHADCPPNTPIYNDANFGGFVVYFFPKFRTFMDDRFELYGADWCRDYVYWTEQEPERIWQYIQQVKLQRLLVQTGTGLDAYLFKESDRFRELQRTEHAVWYEVLSPQD